jgi:sarcosine oxidase subunit gamma
VPEALSIPAAAAAPVLELPTLTIESVPMHIAVLRIWKPHAEHFSALAEVLGFPWPAAPNQVSGTDTRVLWLAPDSWAIVGPAATSSREWAAQALGERLHHVSVVTEGRAVFTLRGPLARALLSKDCSLDLHPRKFGAGQCAQSLLAQVPILLEPLAVAEAHAVDYRLYVDISYVGYLRAWFADAAVEYSATLSDRIAGVS